MSSEPQKAIVRRLGRQEGETFAALIRIFHAAFEMEEPTMAPQSHLDSLLLRDDFEVWCVWHEGQLAGGLTLMAMPQYFTPLPFLYLHDVAISPDHQRMGLGTALLDGVRRAKAGSGYGQLFVQADEEDDHAVEFYHQNGYDRGRAVNFYYHLDLEDPVE
jgi:aminoglycoside 3-N-acetyltransferase I